MEPRQLLSGTPECLSVLSGIAVQDGMYVPGHKFGAVVDVTSNWQGLDGLPVTLALSKDRIVGNRDDVVLGTSNVTTTSWPGMSYTFSSANFNVTLPASLKDGTYHVVAESYGGSRVVGPSITVKTPKAGTDLAINYGSMFTWLWPETPGQGNASVRNDGTVDSGP